MCANLAIIGIKNCWHGRRAVIFEAILQASFILLQANNIAGWRNEDNSLVRTELYSLGQIFIFRNARLIKDMRMIKSFEFIVQTLGYLTKPILTKFFFIYLVEEVFHTANESLAKRSRKLGKSLFWVSLSKLENIK